ncbi:MAG: beta-glucosidase BglX [Gemmatirosa sp.]|nr:beta-glucosidase BglX [Gemmatirosa sp.]
MCAALGIACLTSAAGAQARTRADAIADSVLRLMTLDEKVGQLVQTPGGRDQTGPIVPAGSDQQIRDGKVGSFLSFYGAAAIRRLQRIAVEESRLHVPLLFAYDVIHGWRTEFPTPLGEAASFDPASAERAARIAAEEASAFGIHWTFAPMVDIARDPRWGRVVEGSGEDPTLGSALAAARVRGFQNGPAGTTLLATVKHFAAYGSAEGGRDYDTAELSERTLWDVYLPPYEAAVRAGAATVMSAFNDLGGMPAHGNRWLLTEVLRDRWRFDGILVSDWAGVSELLSHRVAGTKGDAVARAMHAGVDVDMSDGFYASDLAAAVRAGAVSQRAVDSAAWRMLRLKASMGLFDDPYRSMDTTRERTASLTPAHRAAAREIAGKSIVLLRNERRVLPLAKRVRTLAVIGPLADDRAAALGPWNGAGRPEDVVTPLAGIRAAVPNARVTYARGVPVDSMRTSGIAAAVQAARAADAVILVLGESADMSGEASSRASLDLPGAQLALAQAVVRAAPGKPVVAVLMNGRPLSVPWLADSVPAVVESWFLGVEHGHALADVLFGDVNPGGRLPMTVPRSVGQVPIYHAHKSTGRPPDPANHYSSKYLDLPWTPLYPFGFGLSYTTFAYGTPQLSASSVRAGDSVVVEVDVTNTGQRAGDEVVQLYLRDDVASVTRPVRQLAAFQRVTLGAGERRRVRLAVGANAMALYDAAMRRVVEPGTFTLWVGGSSEASVESRFTVTGDTLVLAPAVPRMR